MAPDDVPVIEPLLHALIDSAAFDEAADMLFDLLERTPGHVPALLLAVVERFLATSGRDAADISTSAAALANEAGDLLIRAYSQSEDAEIRHRCLELIDGLIGQEAYGIERALERASR